MVENAHIVIDTGSFSPIDDIESFVITTHWQYDRMNSHELIIHIKGQYCEYQVTNTWIEHSDILHTAFSFSIGLSKEIMSAPRELALLKLLSLMNESLQIGHFDLWREENAIVWRYGQFLSEHHLSLDSLSRLFRMAIDTCERHYPAFQFVLWAGHNPVDALHFVLFETIGQA